MSSLHTPHLLRLLRAAVADQPLPVLSADAWGGVFDTARRQDVAAFLLPAIACQTDATAPPAAVAAPWRTLHRQAVAQQVCHERQAAMLLRAFREAGIRCLPLKGLWLAAQVYPEPGQRPMCDIDLLVQPEQFEVAAVIMQRLGYAALGTAARTAFDYDVVFRHPEWTSPVELHWQMGSRAQELGPLPDLRPLWQSAVAGRLAGEECEWPAPEEHLALLVYHVVHHRFTLPLRAYLDLALLLRHFAASGFAPTVYRAAAGHWNVRRALPLLLMTTADLLGEDLTRPLAAVLPADAGWARRQRDEAAACVLDEESGRGGLRAEGTWVDFRRRGMLARARLLWSRVWMPPEFVLRDRPRAGGRAGLAWAYLKRAWGLAVRNRVMLLRLLRGDDDLRRRLALGERRIELARWALAEGDGDTPR